jgi:hypothetical protein
MIFLLACGKEMLPGGLGYQSSLAAITDLAIGERTIRMFLNYALKSVRQVLTDEGCLENVKTSHVNPVFLSRGLRTALSEKRIK